MRDKGGERQIRKGVKNLGSNIPFSDFVLYRRKCVLQVEGMPRLGTLAYIHLWNSRRWPYKAKFCNSPFLPEEERWFSFAELLEVTMRYGQNASMTLLPLGMFERI